MYGRVSPPPPAHGTVCYSGSLARKGYISWASIVWNELMCGDPDSSWRNPYVGGLDQQILLLCDHGYSSVFAAATLVELGFAHSGDVIGGYAAWRDAGLPTAPSPPRRREPGEPAGMRPPDR